MDEPENDDLEAPTSALAQLLIDIQGRITALEGRVAALEAGGQ